MFTGKMYHPWCRERRKNYDRQNLRTWKGKLQSFSPCSSLARLFRMKVQRTVAKTRKQIYPRPLPPTVGCFCCYHISFHGLQSKARAIAIRSGKIIRWRFFLKGRLYSRFWPPDSWDPLPPTSVSKPLRDEGQRSKKIALGQSLSILASRQAISSCVTSSAGLVAPSRMLNLIVPA